MKSSLFALAAFLLAAGPAAAGEIPVAEPGGLGVLAGALGALLALKVMRRK